jgi:SPP1 gp7 family putative phage head morphogenesis protein
MCIARQIDFAGRTRRVTKNAFSEGRKALNRVSLKSALTGKDEIAIFTLVSKAITAFEKAFRAPFEAVTTDVMDASGKAAARNLRKAIKLRAAAPSIGDLKFDVTNPKAVEWIKQNAGDLIKGINETTRQEIRDLVEAAFEEQYDVDDLADQIEELLGDADRAETIARTETMRASNEGQAQLWDQATETGFLTGTEKQEWIVTPDDRLCPICEPLDGETAELGGVFESDGEEYDAPPAHPNCRCTIGLAV